VSFTRMLLRSDESHMQVDKVANSYMKPLISVITVCYNAASTLAATLDSVRAQTWRPLESVIMDDGSKDGTQDSWFCSTT